METAEKFTLRSNSLSKLASLFLPLLRPGKGSWAIGGCQNALALQPPLNLGAPSFSVQALLITCVIGGFCPRLCKLSAPIRWVSVGTSMG